MKSAFPFKDPQTDYLHRKVVAEIQCSDYHFHLPHLNETSWSTILNNSAERERLEFVGDALIGAFIAEEIYKRRPDGGPGYYTIAKSVLTANSTFAHLMNKAGLFNDLSRSVKPAGDAFETIIASLHSEQGSKVFQLYARECFLPLIETVALAYDEFRTLKTRQRKFKRMALNPTSPPGSRRNKGKSGAKAKKLRTTTLSVNSSLRKRTEPQQHSSTSIRTPVAIIDLTEDSTEQESFSNGKIQDFRFKLLNQKQILDSSDSTAGDSSNEIRDLLLSISGSSAVRKESKSELKILAQHTLGEDALQDDLVTRFRNTSLLGTMHNPITID